MIELWSKEQMDAVLTQDRCRAIQDEALKHPMPKNLRVDFKDGGHATVLDYDPFRLVVSCDKLLAAISWDCAARTWEVYQVMHKTVMVPTTTYEPVRKR
jgi:hypothetical protein